MSSSSNTTGLLSNATLALFTNNAASSAISAIYIIVTAVNLIGNSLSMWLLLFRTSPKTPSIIFMINLTLTDLALGAALPFQISYQLQGYNWTLGSGMCRFLTVGFYANMYCSIMSMTAISVDRYLGIVRPMWFRQTRERKSFALIGCVFMWALVLATLSPLMTTDLTFHFPELGITTCFDFLRKDMLPSLAAWVAFLFTLVFVLFLLPFCVTVFCYVGVIRELARDDSKTEQKERAIRLAGVVLLVFTVCFAPNNILLLVHTVSQLFYKRSIYTAYKLSLAFSCLNSCLDPFIYYFASKDFRQKLRHMLRIRTVSGTDNWRESHYSTQYMSRRAGGGEQQNLVKTP